MTHTPPPIAQINEMNKVGSHTETTKSADPKKFAVKTGLLQFRNIKFIYP